MLNFAYVSVNVLVFFKVDMMEDLDGLNVCHTSMAEIIDSINYNDNTSIKCGIMIRKKSFSFHCTEVDLSCSSKIKVSSGNIY